MQSYTSFDSSDDDHGLIFRRRSKTNCTCEWEFKYGYGVAFTLAVFEAKRLFVLVLEILAEWQVIRFAGGLRPVALTLTDLTLGLSCALITVRTIRRHKLSDFHSKTKRVLRCLLIVIVACAIMKIATLVSIGYYMNIRQETLVDVFNASMQLYVSATSYKYAIDKIQFMFQCCGHTSYTDWFLFDWQNVDYASREEMARQSKISDEDYRDRSVPYSCCNLHVMAPCVHTELMDDKTININGCAKVISFILLRFIIVAYIMTSTLIIMQMLLAYLMMKMICKVLPLRPSLRRTRCSITPFTIINALPRTFVLEMSRFSSVKKSARHKRLNVRSIKDVRIEENRKAKSCITKTNYFLYRRNC